MTIGDRELRERGIRLTPQRHLILQAIAESNGHVTAEDIYQRVAGVYPDVNISTVYRNLERLCDLGLVAVTDLGRGRVYYEALGSVRHHHLICHNCGQMIEISDAALEDLRRTIMQQHGFAVGIDHLALWGLCAQCRAKSPPV